MVRERGDIILKSPSDKQVALARAIANKLNLPLPSEFSAQAYWQFTNDNAARAANVPNPPSEKQIRTARYIASNLGVPLPVDFTAKAYWEFTQKYLAQSRSASEERRKNPSLSPREDRTERREDDAFANAAKFFEN